MNNILHFVPLAEHENKLNLEAYIAFHRGQRFIIASEWGDNIWDVTKIAETHRHSKTGSRIYFRSWTESKKNHSKEIGGLMPSPFIDFAKAYVIEYATKQNSTQIRRVVMTLQALAAATETLRNQACITQVDNEVLDYATQLLRARYSATSVWMYGRVLQGISDRIREAGLIKWNVPWKQPFAYKQPARNDRVYKKADSRLTNRLPDVRAILSLAEIHHQSNAENDKIVTAFSVIAMLAPERAGEILTLPVNCKTSMPHQDNEILGIRWRPLKGGQAKTNWAVSKESSTVTEEAINFLIKRGEKARKAAHWYANNPRKLYLPEGFEHLREQEGITMWEAAQILGRLTASQKGYCKLRNFGFTQSIGTLCGEKIKSRHPVSLESKQAKYVKLFSINELERFVLNKLPKAFPILESSTGLHYHNALWCLPTNILCPGSETLEYVPTTLSINQINHQLGSNPGGITIFSRNNKIDDNGQPWKISTHQFRHLLNTLAQSKYLSQELIAFWSGRKHATQNAWYNHLPQEAFIEAYLKIEGSVPELQIQGSLEDKVKSVSHSHEISRKDALSYEIGSTHKTRYGICRHDYSLTPCPKDKDCINCGEHIFVKGNTKQIKEAKEQVTLFEKGLFQAKKALQDGRIGAQRWIDLHTPKLKRWKDALILLTDPVTSDGTLISMPRPEVSQSKTGLAQSIRDTNSSPSFQIQSIKEESHND